MNVKKITLILFVLMSFIIAACSEGSSSEGGEGDEVTLRVLSNWNGPGVNPEFYLNSPVAEKK